MNRKGAVSFEIMVPIQILRDLLYAAVEGGSNYWAEFRNAEWTESCDYRRVKVTELKPHEEGVRRINRYVTAEDLTRGLAKLAEAAVEETNRGRFPAAGEHLGDALSANGDATTADVVLQMTVFGRLIYQ